MKYPALIILTCALGCHGFRDPSLSEAKETEVHKVDTANMATLSSKASVKQFYASRDNVLFWSAANSLSPLADSVLSMITKARRLGLDPNCYHANELKELMSDSLMTNRLQRIDILITDAWLTMYSHVRFGQLDPRSFSPRNWALSVNKDAIEALKVIDTYTVTQLIRNIEPPFKQYHDLKKILQAFNGPGLDSLQVEQARKIALNMERWRWQKALPSRYISVNIPAFMLRVHEADSLWLQTKVIVGKRATPTPVMESIIRSFTIYPYWHVPKSISTQEILPNLQRDRHYLRRNNFDVLDAKGTVILADTIQWDFYSRENFPFVLRQREGSENSMGIIKFDFANNYNVYLHDTNSKRLYQQSRRDLSHGCVRVSDAVGLAHYLVREDDIYVSPEDLDQYLSLQQRLKIDLRKPIPLRLEYFTVEVIEGVPAFYEDIYKKDSAMSAALNQKVTNKTLVRYAASEGKSLLPGARE